jgi:Hydantoinase B/oxoprolinase
LIISSRKKGGWGATNKRDGASGMIAVTDGDTYNYSIELLEAKFPLLIRRYEYNVESGVGADATVADLVWCANMRSKATALFCTPVMAAPQPRLGPSTAEHQAVSTALKCCAAKRSGGSHARPIFRSTAAIASASARVEAAAGASLIRVIRSPLRAMCATGLLQPATRWRSTV